jgi:CubicO group peptidase (beta-lactamase class C family)
MKTFLARQAGALAAVAIFAAPAAAQAGAGHPYGPDDLRRDADAITAVGVTGVQARVTVKDGRDAVATSGVADLTTGRPVAPDGYFRAASATKTFTATVILQLAGQGRLSLDDTVDHWLPGLVSANGNDGREITVRQLLQNTSGIHDDIPGFASAEEYYAHRHDTYSPARLVARAMGHRPDFPPGTGWSYSGTGYLILGMIIQRATGHSWYQEVRTRIIEPLRLTHTLWPGGSPALPDPHARAYERYADGDPLLDVTDQTDFSGAAGGLVTTTADLNRFLSALLGGRLLRPAQLREMLTTVPVSDDLAQVWPGARDGLGLFSRPLSCGGVYWGHEGGEGGYITANGVTADASRSVVVSMSTALDPEQAQQEQATGALVDHALCGTLPKP